MRIYTVFHTAAGWVGLIGSSAGLQRIILPKKSEREVWNLLADDAVPEPGLFSDLTEHFQAYFSGQKVDFPDVLDFSYTTPFQREVWQTARMIPYGQTRSYRWVAEQIGRPGAYRAVGQALGKNPFPIIIPCHRVLASNGGLGGFSGGIEMKKYLLALEKRS